MQVERLFSDLIHTTDSLKRAKLGLQKLPSTGVDPEQVAEDVVEPYRADNARLVQENNQLHYEFVKVKEELDASTKSESSAKILMFYSDTSPAYLTCEE